MKSELDEIYGKLVNQLPTGEGLEFVFSANSFSPVPEQISSRRLIITKQYHYYEDCFRTDQLNLFATKEVFRQLGLLILNTVFAGGRTVTLSLTNPNSVIKRVVIGYEGSTPRVNAVYFTRPDRFIYTPTKTDAEQFLLGGVEERPAPQFFLTTCNGSYHTEEEWSKRDTVKGFGSDDACIVFAEMLLNFGWLQNESTEIYLGSQFPPRRVSRFSAEVALYLPEHPAFQFDIDQQ